MGVVLVMPRRPGPDPAQRLCSECWFALLARPGVFCSMFNEPILDETDAMDCLAYTFDGMSAPTLAPAPSGVAPGRVKTAVGHDEQCSWVDHHNVRCTETATDTVFGQLFCSEHADLMVGM